METIILVGEQGDEVIILKEASKLSQMLQDLIDELGDDEPIELPMIDGRVLLKVKKFLEHYYSVGKFISDSPFAEVIITEWDREFLNVKDEMLFKLLEVADLMQIRLLSDICSKYIALKMLDAKDSDSIKKIFRTKGFL